MSQFTGAGWRDSISMYAHLRYDTGVHDMLPFSLLVFLVSFGPFYAMLVIWYHTDNTPSCKNIDCHPASTMPTFSGGRFCECGYRR